MEETCEYLFPAEIIYLIFDHITDMKGMAMMGMTCRYFYKGFQDRFDELLPTVNLKKLQHKSLVQFIYSKIQYSNIRILEPHRGTCSDDGFYSINMRREHLINGVYINFLFRCDHDRWGRIRKGKSECLFTDKKRIPTPSIGFYSLDNIYLGHRRATEAEAQKLFDLLDQGRKLEIDAVLSRNVKFLEWNKETDRDVLEAIQEYINRYEDYLTELIGYNRFIHS